MKRTYIFAGGIAVAVLIIGIGIIDYKGYVFSGPYVVKGGTLVIEEARGNSDVFIDNKRVGHTNEEGHASFSGIKIGKRTVIVAHEDSWPWILDFASVSGRTTTLQPLQVFEDPRGSNLVNSEDPLYIRATQNFNDYREPTRIAPLERADVRVWVEGTRILTQKNEEVRTVFTSPNAIRNVFWYGDRTDAVIVASHDKVFALDLRASEIQNFQPIYMGSAPEAIDDPIRTNEIFVRDGQQYLSISI